MSFPNDQNAGGAAIPVWNAAPPVGSRSSTLNITTPTVVKAAAGFVFSFSVQVAGSAPGTINDVATNAPAADNQIAIIPTPVVGIVELNWPCAAGILVVPGTGQTVNVSWS